MPAKAQQFVRYYGPSTLLSGGTNKVAGNTTNVVTGSYRIDVPRAENVVLFTSFKLMTGTGADGTTNITFKITEAADPTMIATNAFWTWSVAANGTTAVSAVTNLNVKGVPYLYIQSIGNGNAQILTNLQFTYGFKN
jgi:hypothetical protein